MAQEQLDTLSAEAFGNPSTGLEFAMLPELLEEANQEAHAVQDAEAETDLKQILETLRENPANDEEATAKFQLYETYANTLQKVREKLFQVWESSNPKFSGSSLQLMEHSMRKVDDTQRMGIFQDDHTWFGFGMMKQAISNNSNMSKLLAEIDTKLGLLDSDDPCPICLESYSDQRMAHVQACCHKVCKECWTNWASLKQNPFCPLCRNQEFVQELHRAHAQFSP
jgi:hypothetical protein